MDQGIDTGIHWQPGHHFSLFSGSRSGDLSVTDKIALEIISLPLHSGMDPRTIHFICAKRPAVSSKINDATSIDQVLKKNGEAYNEIYAEYTDVLTQHRTIFGSEKT